MLKLINYYYWFNIRWEKLASCLPIKDTQEDIKKHAMGTTSALKCKIYHYRSFYFDFESIGSHQISIFDFSRTFRPLDTHRTFDYSRKKTYQKDDIECSGKNKSLNMIVSIGELNFHFVKLIQKQIYKYLVHSAYLEEWRMLDRYFP